MAHRENLPSLSPSCDIAHITSPFALKTVLGWKFGQVLAILSPPWDTVKARVKDPWG